jgi:hypothetical protein
MPLVQIPWDFAVIVIVLLLILLLDVIVLPKLVHGDIFLWQSVFRVVEAKGAGCLVVRVHQAELA